MPGATAPPTERSPLRIGRLNTELALSVTRVLTLGIMYVIVSAGMIAFNKYLMNKDRFPFAVPLTLLHSAFCSVVAFFLYLLKPTMFPSLTDPVKKVPVNSDLIIKGALPIALLFSVQLVLSNTAYLHSSTAFLQMMKEANLVLVYAFSLMFALEVFNWNKGKVLFAIMCATFLTIHGELHFSWLGFVIQVTGQLFESLKIVFQGFVLSSAGYKLDALTYVLLVMPLCFLVLGAMYFCLVFVHPLETLQTPKWKDLQIWWPVLLANSCVAFSLNLTIAMFMKYSSPISFIIAGILKDTCIVCVGATMLGEQVSSMQVAGFGLQLVFIGVWSIMKLFPAQFESGIIAGFTGFLEAKPDKMPIDDRQAAEQSSKGS
mmetsp:Transcript_156420/g.284560  ORF Transcript_156420/g.284560 Transcript_156420/m.284560 type:complete len:374 (-) Transcript_156420:76-1197(-)